MSIDHSEVTSKYFTSKVPMDESLSDFQESKKSCKGPKNIQKPVVKSKVKKTTKRIKGQKDIRTAIQGKKNDLVSYAKDFDNVCKKAGLDVDPEQLQLAIALSKSLQTEACDDSDNLKTLSSQERIGKIRTTLQEYGFKVPDIKITSNKRVKKYKKQYKLLLTTEEDRSQKISNKFSQILFEKLDSSNVDDSKNYEYSEAPLYNLSSSVPYECMRDNGIFYVNDLVEKSISTFCLLRDWSEISGRPVSPKLFKTDTMNFNKTQCSQSELDVILSGSIQFAKEVMNKLVDDRKKYESMGAINDKHNTKSNDNLGNMNDELGEFANNQHKQDIDSNELITVTQQYRSCSPDLFDDEISSIMENTKNSNILSQEYKTKVFSQDNNLMELTECANGLSQSSNKPNSQLSQNATKRKSNDLMEITDCIVSSSQPILENIKHKIDLTQNPEHVTNDDLHNITPVDIQSIDLTQTFKDNIDISHSPNNVTVLVNTKSTTIINEVDSGKSPKHDIDLTQSPNEDNVRSTDVDYENIESMDLTQSSNSTDGLPLVKVDSTNFDDTIILNENEYLGTDGKVKKSILPDNNVTDEVFDLTHQGNSIVVNTKDAGDKTNLGSQSLFEEFAHDHSYSVTSNDEESYNDKIKMLGEDDGDIDLTQDSDSEESNKEFSSSLQVSLNIANNSSLGKKDDISIDYDEVCYDPSIKDSSLKESISNISQTKNGDEIVEVIDLNNEAMANSSQNSEVFDISDKELDYSLYKSRHDVPVDNFDFGGISIMDNITRVKSFGRSFSEDNGNSRKTSNSSFLPEGNIKRIGNVQPNNIGVPTDTNDNTEPNKNDVAPVPIETPNSGRFIVKTDGVTPILNYASMTTPQRNKELDKYGLKPFKRKRAIQLLTHLYNQTHPIVEPCTTDDLPSPSKKSKTNPNLPLSTSEKEPQNNKLSPKEKYPGNSANLQPSNSENSRNVQSSNSNAVCGNTPLQNSQSPRPKSAKKSLPNVGCSKENVCVYEVTSESPSIRSIECSPEDWVFQKREKAKVHSCQVPLHIALHNYVYSRRGLRESILRYEPVNIDVIHKDLVGYGHRYDPKDLLRFLDKKCITVKTADNNSRNKK